MVVELLSSPGIVKEYIQVLIRPFGTEPFRIPIGVDMPQTLDKYNSEILFLPDNTPPSILIAYCGMPQFEDGKTLSGRKIRVYDINIINRCFQVKQKYEIPVDTKPKDDVFVALADEEMVRVHLAPFTDPIYQNVMQNVEKELTPKQGHHIIFLPTVQRQITLGLLIPTQMKKLKEKLYDAMGKK